MSESYERLTTRELAARIDAYLRRFERDPEINRYPEGHPAREQGLRPYWNAGAHASGRYVRVVYISYQGSSVLTRAEAIEYLRWLDAGNEGTHYRVRRQREVNKL